MTVQDLLTKYNLTQTELSRKFDIPLRTVQSWCNAGSSHRECPKWAAGMIRMIIELEKEIERLKSEKNPEE